MKKIKGIAAVIISAIMLINFFIIPEVQGVNLAGTGYQADILFIDGNKSFISLYDSKVNLIGDGNYSMSITTNSSSENSEMTASGVTVFQIEVPYLYDALLSANNVEPSELKADTPEEQSKLFREYFKVNVNIDSIKVDGKEVAVDNSRLLVGDIETMGDTELFRIVLYYDAFHEESEDGAAYVGAIDPDDIAFSKSMDIDFSVSGLDDALAGIPGTETKKTSGDFKYVLLEDGSAEITDYTGSETKLLIPEELKGVKVTSIGNNAFQSCSDVVEFVLPEGITNIGDFAFESCASLEKINLPDKLNHIGESAFSLCCSIKEIIIPDSVTEIGNNVFWGCDKMRKVSLPENISYLPDGIFRECTELDNVTIPDSVERIGNYAFDYCISLSEIIIPENVKSVGTYAFADCKTLSEMVFPNSVQELGYSVLTYCDNLQTVTLSENITVITPDMFFNCPMLSEINVGDNKNFITEDGVLYDSEMTTIILFFGDSERFVIPNGIQYIEQFAFANSDLSEIVFNSDMERISFGAFEDCGSLVKVTVPEGISYIDGCAFASCTALEEVNLPESIVYIGMDAFQYCESLKEFSMPDSVTEVDSGVFACCTSLEQVKLSNKINSITDYMFRSCTNLETVVIPDSVTHIGNGAFQYCNNLLSITIPENVQAIGEEVFDGCTNLNKMEISNNEYFLIENGALITADRKEMVYLAGDNDNKFILPDGVEYIRSYAFSARNVNEIILNDDIETIGEYAFANCLDIKKITIPENVNTIGYRAFYQCGLKEIDFSEGLVAIGEEVFYLCQLTRVTLPESIKEIGCMAFNSMNFLGRVYIPDGIEFIDPNAFYSCDSIVIRCNKGSYGFNYALEHGFPLSVIGENIIGDIDENGKVTAFDARAVLMMIVQSEVYDKVKMDAADVNGDGKVTAIDARIILQVAAGNVILE